jgi:hypothetical protein
MLRARWVMLRARWVMLRARWVMYAASGGETRDDAGHAAAAEETCELYLQHLCRFEPAAAKPFLQSCETYRVDRWVPLSLPSCHGG